MEIYLGRAAAPLIVTRYVTVPVTRVVTKFIGVVTRFVTYVEISDEEGKKRKVKRVVSTITRFYDEDRAAIRTGMKTMGEVAAELRRKLVVRT